MLLEVYLDIEHLATEQVSIYNSIITTDSLMPIIDSLLSLIAPHECIGCNDEGSLLCQSCADGMADPIRQCYKCHIPAERFATCPDCRIGSALASVLPAVKYTGLAKDIVWKIKFGRTRSASQEIASVIVHKLRLQKQLAGKRQIILTHAPTATSRVRQRGYDQAALIARSVAGQSHATYLPLLARTGQQKQIGASRSQRKAQLQSAFRPLRCGRIKGVHIILIDDVVTTGATLEAAAQALIDAGARRVDAVVFAQA